MVQVIPPPPQLPSEFQALNRWLLEIQSIFQSNGLINPDQVDGLTAAYTQIDTNTADIATNTADIATNTADIATNTAGIAALSVALAALTARVAAVEARGEILNDVIAPAPGLGKVNDWYADTVAKKIYVKTAAATWTNII